MRKLIDDNPGLEEDFMEFMLLVGDINTEDIKPENLEPCDTVISKDRKVMIEYFRDGYMMSPASLDSEKFEKVFDSFCVEGSLEYLIKLYKDNKENL